MRTTPTRSWALIIAIIAGIIASRWWGRPAGTVFGAVVFSHWLLDLLVHRAYMPILQATRETYHYSASAFGMPRSLL